MRARATRMIAMVGALAIGHGVAVAEDPTTTASLAPTVRTDTAATMALDEGFGIRAAGYAWFPRFDGDVSLGPMQLDLRDDLGHGGTRTVPWGELDLRLDIWEFRLDGYTAYEDASSIATRSFDFGSLAVLPGDRVRSDLNVDSIGAELGVVLYRPFAERRWPWETRRCLDDKQRETAELADLRFGVTGMMRWVGLEHEVEAFDPGGVRLGREEVDADWLVLGGGPTIEIALRTKQIVGFLDQIVVRGMAGAGGVVAGGGGSMWQVRAGIDLMFSPNFGLSLGYRLQEFDVRDGDYRLDGGLQGLVVGGSVRF